MAQFLITFTGHVDETRRPEDFPKKIFDLLLILADDNDGVVKAVNDHSKNYIRNQGMSVRMDPSATEDASVLDTNRMWVPLHMLTHFTADVKQITDETSMMSQGVTMVKN
jgi:hypothetical protein